MLGPDPIGKGESIFHHKDGDQQMGSKIVRYTSDDKLLACRLTSYIFKGNLERVEEEGGTIRLIPEDYFIIDVLRGSERLIEIIKELNIAEEFPIVRKTETEAVDLCRKILDYNETPEAWHHIQKN